MGLSKLGERAGKKTFKNLNVTEQKRLEERIVKREREKERELLEGRKRERMLLEGR